MCKEGEELVGACQATRLRSNRTRRRTKEIWKRTKERERRPLKFPTLIDNVWVEGGWKEVVGDSQSLSERAPQILG